MMLMAMQFELPPLPYELNALEPVISARTMELHHDELQKAYAEKLNKYSDIKVLPDGTPLETVLFGGAQAAVPEDPFHLPQQLPYDRLFDVAAQLWNHTFFWNCLKPHADGGGGEPHGKIADGIRVNFGTFVKFRETMRQRALGLFGSGWVWVGVKGEALWIFSGSNAAMPLIYGISPVLTIDMWEHAYYLDYQTDRSAYFDAVMDKLINWDFANENLQNAVF
jgi:Fe-Mn family superoxide dismutase